MRLKRRVPSRTGYTERRRVRENFPERLVICHESGEHQFVAERSVQSPVDPLAVARQCVRGQRRGIPTRVGARKQDPRETC